jgi:hypothetical protein
VDFLSIGFSLVVAFSAEINSHEYVYIGCDRGARRKFLTRNPSLGQGPLRSASFRILSAMDLISHRRKSHNACSVLAELNAAERAM